MKISRKGLLAAIAVSAVLLLSFRAASPQQSSPQLSSEQIAQIVASPDRSEADRTNDLRRKPEQMLALIGIRRSRYVSDPTTTLDRSLGSLPDRASALGSPGKQRAVHRV